MNKFPRLARSMRCNYSELETEGNIEYYPNRLFDDKPILVWQIDQKRCLNIILCIPKTNIFI